MSRVFAKKKPQRERSDAALQREGRIDSGSRVEREAEREKLWTDQTGFNVVSFGLLR